jgi:hypothetical protein
MDEVRRKLAGAKISDEVWKSGGYGGPQIVATFPNYEVRVMFLGNKAITSSMQVLSEE